MVCLETTFLIDLLRGSEQIKQIKDELDASGEMLTIAAPSLMEIWLGACLAQNPSEKKSKISEFLEGWKVLDLDEKSAKEAGEILAELIKKGMIIETSDVLIAAIVRSNGEKLVTRDEHFARIPGLRVLKY